MIVIVSKKRVDNKLVPYCFNFNTKKEIPLVIENYDEFLKNCCVYSKELDSYILINSSLIN